MCELVSSNSALLDIERLSMPNASINFIRLLIKLTLQDLEQTIRWKGDENAFENRYYYC